MSVTSGPARPTTRPVSPSASPRRPPADPAPTPDGYLHQLDTFRVIAFTAVVAVHVLNGVVVQAGLGGTIALALLLVTRKAFFVLIALVAARSWLRRSDSPWASWRRQLPLVALPYVTWTAIYGYPLLLETSSPGAALRRFVGLVLTGDASYHLYFLLASLQVYVALPLLLRVVRWLGRWQLPLLAVSLAVQVGQHVLIEYGRIDIGPVGWYRHNCGELAVTYQFWVLLGLVAGLNLHHVQRAVDASARWLVVLAGVAAVATGVWVTYTVGQGEIPGRASSTFSPYLVGWCVVAIIGTYAAATLAVRAMRPGGRLGRAVHVGAQASFGVYLAHPLLLPYLGRFLAAGPPLPLPLWVVLLTALTAATTLLVVSVLRLTPFSRALCGRPRKPRPHRRDQPRGGAARRENQSHAATPNAANESRSAVVNP